MRPLPEYLNPSLPAARRLTKVLRTIDQDVLCAWNGRSQCYEVWGPSREYGWACLKMLLDEQHQPISPDLYPMYVLGEMHARLERLDAKELMEGNMRRLQREWSAELDTMGEAAKYVAAAVGQEAESALRHGAADVLLGLNLALQGKAKGAPVGQKFSLPGQAVAL